MDERIRRIVMSQPVPMKLAAALYAAPDLSEYRSANRVLKAKQWGVGSLDPDELTPTLTRTLTLICHGYTNEEIARRTYYALDTIRDHTKALLGIFSARNRAHLAALAVAQGYVSILGAPAAPP